MVVKTGFSIIKNYDYVLQFFIIFSILNTIYLLSTRGFLKTSPDINYNIFKAKTCSFQNKLSCGYVHTVIFCIETVATVQIAFWPEIKWLKIIYM